MDNPSIRIAKRIADAGLCSRRTAEQWILDGRVKVNGEILSTPAKIVSLEDQILVDNVPLPTQDSIRLWLYHKPGNVITSHKDPEGRRTVFESLPKGMPRVISIGRLDLHSEGLLLLTNNGEVARFFELPSSALPRTYRVRIYGNPPSSMIAKLQKGVVVEGIQYGSIKASLDPGIGANKWLTLILTEGKNREIRRLMQYFDLTINRLIRIAYGPYELRDLAPGEVWEISPSYVQQTLKSLGFKKS